MRLITRICLLVWCANAALAGEYRIETHVEGLTYPWAIAFLPGGDLLVTERPGRLRRIIDGELLQEPVANVPEVFVLGQGGLLDVVPDVNFAANRRLFLSYSSGDRRANALQVVSATLAGNRLENVNTIFTAAPTRDTPHHFGGRIAQLPDQTLLITVGEGFDYREKAQYLDNHLGKVIRINKDGSVPADNPFINRAGAMPEIWSYGHRSQQGLLVAADGTVWLHEHGPRGGDELNIIKPGKNYGWPAITHGVDYSGAYVSPFTAAKGMEQPVVYWTPSIAPAGFCEYQGDAFPQWRGNLFIATLKERSVRRLVLEAGEVKAQEILFQELGERIREVRAGPDGLLYLLTDSEQGRVLRVLPVH